MMLVAMERGRAVSTLVPVPFHRWQMRMAGNVTLNEKAVRITVNKYILNSLGSVTYLFFHMKFVAQKKGRKKLREHKFLKNWVPCKKRGTHCPI